MADCKVCGGWFSSTAQSELCPTCERALKRLNGYAVPVVRCKDCKHLMFSDCYGECNKFVRIVRPDDFCSFGERKDRE